MAIVKSNQDNVIQIIHLNSTKLKYLDKESFHEVRHKMNDNFRLSWQDVCNRKMKGETTDEPWRAIVKR